MNILCVGGFDAEDPKKKEVTEEFTRYLGKEIVKQGHTLLNGCMTDFDAVITESAVQYLKKKNAADIDRKVVSYLPRKVEPSHNNGNIIQSKVNNWGMVDPKLNFPEPVEKAHAIICVGGYDGTNMAANLGRIAQKTVLPVARFGGASSQIYDFEREKIAQNKNYRIELQDFEILAGINSSNEELAQRVVNLAERVKSSGNAFVIMSFKDDPSLKDTHASFKTVCKIYDPPYRCIRLDEEKGIKRIFPEILRHIEQSAFVFVDLTLGRPNVYYELGYAEALEKPIIATAKEGTEIHFDAKDIPIIFWNSQEDFKKELVKTINEIAKNQGRKPVQYPG